MGKATRWLRSLLGSSKKSSSSTTSPSTKHHRKSTSLGQIKSSDSVDQKLATFSGDDRSSTSYAESIDANKHAIAVAAATAAVAEAALAAAQAAAEVVRLTSSGTGRSLPSAYGGSSRREERRRELAAIKIQSAFRAYLARRALRALKGLVKLQAMVRGRIARKQSADMLRRMQAMARIQARVCANRAYVSGTSQSFSNSAQCHLAGNAKFSRYEQQHSLGGQIPKRGDSRSRYEYDLNVQNMVGLESSWLDHWMKESMMNGHGDVPSTTNLGVEDDKSDKILEIDTWKPRNNNSRQVERTFQGGGTHYHLASQKENRHGVVSSWDSMSGISTKFQKPSPSVSSMEMSSLKSPKLTQQEDQLLWTANNSPHGQSTSSRPGSAGRRGPFTPTRSECSRSFFGEYAGYPNYMTNTESSIARARCQSAPRQRLHCEKVGSTGSRHLVYGKWDVETSSEKGFSPHANLRCKASVQNNRVNN